MRKSNEGWGRKTSGKLTVCLRNRESGGADEWNVGVMSKKKIPFILP